MTEFSFSDKLRFNTELAALLKKEGKTGAVGKAVKKAKAAKGSDSESKPKRKAAPGTLAWMAFVKHCKATMAERFTETTKETERLSICKAIRAEDSAAYETFISDFKANYSVPSAEEETPVAPVAPVAPVTPAKKVAPKKTPEVKTSEAKAPATPAKTEVKAPVAPGAPKKAAKKPVKAAAPTKAAEAVMPQIEIDGENYFHDRSNNGLWKVEEGDSFGAWVGYYQPENTEEPIRHTDSME